MKAQDYINAIVLCLNGQHLRFSASLQTVIHRFQKAFSSEFYKNCVLCLTHWYMDHDSLETREEDGISEESVAQDINEKLCSANLGCDSHLPVVFVDTFARNSAISRNMLEKLQQHIPSTVFRTADLHNIKPTITSINNSHQLIKHGTSIVHIIPALLDPEVRVINWDIKPNLPVGLKIDKRGIISGCPVDMMPLTTFQLFAESMGGWSHGQHFNLEVYHNEEDINGLISLGLNEVRACLEELLCVATVPTEDGKVKYMLDKAKSASMEIYIVAASQLRSQLEVYSIGNDVMDRLSAENERLFMRYEHLYLIASNTAISDIKRRQKAESDLNIQLLKKTNNLPLLRTCIATAEANKGNKELIIKAKEWLADITPIECPYSCNGCRCMPVPKDVSGHENVCLFRMPYNSKMALNRRPCDCSIGSNVQVKSLEESLVGWDGVYKWDDEDCFYYSINRDLGKLYRLKPLSILDTNSDLFIASCPDFYESKKHFDGEHLLAKAIDRKGLCGVCSKSLGSMSYCCVLCDDWVAHLGCVKRPGKECASNSTWVMTSATQYDEEEEVEDISLNVASSMLDISFEKFTILPTNRYSWNPGIAGVYPRPESIKLLYFGGKWCPYCP
jgi:hypothetical protein